MVDMYTRDGLLLCRNTFESSKRQTETSNKHIFYIQKGNKYEIFQMVSLIGVYRLLSIDKAITFPAYFDILYNPAV